MQLEKSHSEVLASLVDALRQVPAVVAIAAYGSTATRSWSAHSDIDLVAVLDRRPPAESIRMFVRGVPVDLNLRALDDSERGIGGAGFVPTMARSPGLARNTPSFKSLTSSDSTAPAWQCKSMRPGISH